MVLGRLSDVVHTAKGERYIPNYIENRLKFSPYIKDAAVLGAFGPEIAGFFGTPTTRRGIFVNMDVHIAEHLGQAIAYARMNGIVPPWSQ